MTFWTSPLVGDARRQATIDFADQGAGNSKIQYFTAANAPATPGAAPAGPPLVEMVLAKPCGTIVANKIVLEQDDPTGDMIAATGAAVYGRWLAGDGDIIGDGDVSDESGTGFFKVAGTSGTMLYAGARAILGETEIA